jgi:hypothetical protein
MGASRQEPADFSEKCQNAAQQITAERVSPADMRKVAEQLPH